MTLLRKLSRSTALNLALNVLHLYILVCGGLIIMMVSVVQGGRPNFSPGWLLILLGAMTIVAGASGIGRTVGPCFAINIIFNLLAAIGSAGFSLACFSKREKVAQGFHSKRYSLHAVDSFIGRVTWAFYVLVIAEIFGIFFGILGRQLGAPETPEQNRERRSIALQRLSQDLSAKEVRRASQRAELISEKMKKKYGQWTHE